MKTTTENTLENFGFEILSSDEMNKVCGGVDVRPKTRDKDVYDDDDEVQS